VVERYLAILLKFEMFLKQKRSLSHTDDYDGYLKQFEFR